MGEVMKEAAFSLAEAKFATGDFNQVVLQNVTKAQIKVRTKKDNVAGKLVVSISYILFSCVFNYKIGEWGTYFLTLIFHQSISTLLTIYEIVLYW